MQEVYHVETISELNKLLNQDKPKHPLVSVVDFSKVESFGENNVKTTLGFYLIMLKDNPWGKLKYGRENYDFEVGTLVCIAPNQVAFIDNEGDQQNKVSGWGLSFHPDLIRGTSLGSKMKDYSFFSYEVNEALHLSDKENQTLNDCVANIENELSQNIDLHSQNLIVSNIELLLNYCIRYYDRQFITRRNGNKDILIKFETILANYFNSDKLKSKWLPTVNYCSEQIYISTNY